jgi:hypothetical protein
MYLRHTIRKKDGKVQRYWCLVRSVRVGRRVIQRTVALGELDEQGRIEARALARHLIGAPEQAALFDDGSRDVAVPVRLKGIRIERSRQFGDVYLALALWRGVGLAELIAELVPAGKERVAWEKIAAVLVAARLCAPSSELHIAEDWYRRTALADLLQLDDALLNKDRLYRALDQLIVHKAAIEAHLSRRAGELFAVDNEVLLYDVTSTCFEGQAEANALAQRGCSRDHRSDCKQRVDREQVDRQIGRILQQNQRAARRFKVRLAEHASPAGFRLEVEVDAAFDDWAALSEGVYLLRSNITDWTDEQLWKAYIQLTQAEAAFRIQKDRLKVRPIWPQRADRVEAHILVCFLAFVLWKTLEAWQSRAGLGNAPRTVLEELQRIQSHDVVLPTTTHGQIRLRCVTQPDPAQAALLDRLGVVLPKRMRLAEHELPVLVASA